jgi:hypothetical protein
MRALQVQERIQVAGGSSDGNDAWILPIADDLYQSNGGGGKASEFVDQKLGDFFNWAWDSTVGFASKLYNVATQSQLGISDDRAFNNWAAIMGNMESNHDYGDEAFHQGWKGG